MSGEKKEEKKIDRRKYIKYVGAGAVVAAAAAAIGYGVSELTKPPPPTPTTVVTTVPAPTTIVTTVPTKIRGITVIGHYGGEELKAFEPVLKAFEEKTGIPVKWLTYRTEEQPAVLNPQFESGKTPCDVVLTTNYMYPVEYAKKGHVYSLDGIVKEDDYLPNILERYKWQGHLWGVSTDGGPKSPVINTEFFEKNGLEWPYTSWEDWVKMLDKGRRIPGVEAPIGRGNGVGWPLTEFVEQVFLTRGNAELNWKLMKGEIKWTDPEVKKIFQEKIVPLIKGGYFGEAKDWYTVVQEWRQNKYVVVFYGPWIATLSGKREEYSKWDYPSLPGAENCAVMTSYTAFIPKYTENLESAIEFLKFVSGPEGQLLHVNAKFSGFVPTLRNIDPASILDPIIRKLYEHVRKAKFAVIDLDDGCPSGMQLAIWDQFKALWANPDSLDQVLRTLDEKQAEFYK